MYDVASDDTEWTEMLVRGLMPRLLRAIVVIENEVVLLGGCVGTVGNGFSTGSTSSAVVVYDTITN